jgi:CRISPR/Cas system-associated exonuclease Cas4 (RecB family)
MTQKRDGLYVWVTWLPKLMTGETNCQWASWFKSHYSGYDKAPTDFQLSVWQAEHNKCLSQLVEERTALNESIMKERQNRFKVRRPSGLVIAGEPDLITISPEGQYKVFDIKTGIPRHSDIIQVMLYMLLLPYASALYIGKQLSGCVVYNDHRTEIPYSAIDENFQKTVTYFLDIVQSPEPPPHTPNPEECRFCEITSADCPHRQEGTGQDEAAGSQNEDFPL